MAVWQDRPAPGRTSAACRAGVRSSRAPLRIALSGLLQHSAGNIETGNLRIGKARAQSRQALPVAAADIDGPARRQLDHVHALLHALADFAQQKIELAEARTAAVERQAGSGARAATRHQGNQQHAGTRRDGTESVESAGGATACRASAWAGRMAGQQGLEYRALRGSPGVPAITAWSALLLSAPDLREGPARRGLRGLRRRAVENRSALPALRDARHHTRCESGPM
jgi:hypothetical protein